MTRLFDHQSLPVSFFSFAKFAALFKFSIFPFPISAYKTPNCQVNQLDSKLFISGKKNVRTPLYLPIERKENEEREKWTRENRKRTPERDTGPVRWSRIILMIAKWMGDRLHHTNPNDCLRIQNKWLSFRYSGNHLNNMFKQ